MKDIRYYLNLPYTAIVRRDEDGDYVARVAELPGCSTHGKSPRAALENLEEAKRAWIEDSIEHRDAVPEPVAEQALPSGKWVQRIPRTLHRQLVQLAQREGVSLNQLVTFILSEAVGARRNKPATAPLAWHPPSVSTTTRRKPRIASAR